jgi:3-hydroxyacyl-[acyl-carrier-protein] dehydratase
MSQVTDLIPHRPPFLFVDEIVSHSAGSLIARRTWRSDEDFYQGHYPSAPITPGVLLCESVFQAAACFMALKALAAGAPPGAGVPLIAKISEVRFRHPVYPGDTVIIEVKEKDALSGFTLLSGHLKKPDGTRILNVDFTVIWKSPEAAKSDAAG